MATRRLPGQGTGLRNLGPGIEYSLVSAIFDHSPHGLVFIDPNLVIRAANRSFSGQVRRRLADILDRPAEEVIPGWTAQVEPIYRQVRRSGEARGGEALPLEFEDQPERGVTYWECAVCPVYEPDREFGGCLLAHNEVTERVRAERDCQG